MQNFIFQILNFSPYKTQISILQLNVYSLCIIKRRPSHLSWYECNATTLYLTLIMLYHFCLDDLRLCLEDLKIVLYQL